MEKLEKGNVFWATMPNGVEIVAACLGKIFESEDILPFNGVYKILLCYGQNRIFTWMEMECEGELLQSHFLEVVVDYARLPAWDREMDRVYKEYAEKEV